MRTLLKATAMAGALLLASANAAQAHAWLVSTNPRQGATFAEAPTKIRLTFNEAITQMSLTVFAPDGRRVPVSHQRSLNDTTTARLNVPSERGRWTIAYRVVSVDGHPVTNTVTFTTTQGSAVKQVNPSPPKESFVHHHRTHLIWVGLAALIGCALVAFPSRRRGE